MSLKAFSISLSNIKLLQNCLSISSSLHGNGVINLVIENDQIISTTSNAMDSCYKHWALPIEQFGKNLTKEPLPQSLKCSIFKGSDFAKKILGQCIQNESLSVLTFHYDEILMNVKQIEVTCISTVSRKKIFSFKFATSDVSLLFTEFDDETIELFFSEKSASTMIYKFDLAKETLTSVRNMTNLILNDDTQNNYITIGFDKKMNQISFTDEITDFRLPEGSLLMEISDELSLDKFNIDKSVFKTIDNIDLTIELREFDGAKFMVLHSKNPNLKYVTTIPLLESIKSTVSYEDILKDTGKFG